MYYQCSPLADVKSQNLASIRMVILTNTNCLLTNLYAILTKVYDKVIESSTVVSKEGIAVPDTVTEYFHWHTE